MLFYVCHLDTILNYSYDHSHFSQLSILPRLNLTSLQEKMTLCLKSLTTIKTNHTNNQHAINFNQQHV